MITVPLIDLVSAERWLAEPSPAQKFGNEYALVPVSALSAPVRKRIGSLFAVRKSADELPNLWALVFRQADVPLAERTGPYALGFVRTEPELREYIRDREGRGWFRKA